MPHGVRRTKLAASAALVLAISSCARGSATAPDAPATPTTPTTSPRETPGPTGQSRGFACTQVIGFSQTYQWYFQAPDFEAAVGDDRWQLLWNAGGGVDSWANPRYQGWSEPILSPCAERSSDPDRIVFNVASRDLPLDPAAFADAIRSTLDIVRERYPSVRQVVLQPVVGGPDGGLCTARSGQVVDATRVQPIVVEAIQMVVGGDVVAGDIPEVRTCDDFQDHVGHLRREANGPIGAAIGAFYARQGRS